VLAVMDSCTDELEKQPGCYYTDAAKLQEARAAVAELIEAAESAMGAILAIAPACVTYEPRDRLRAALARCGGDA